jgi:hypothetical protein
VAGKHSKPGSIADLTDEDNRRFQERTWMVERAGWLVMLAIVVAALAGVFSGGPLSDVEATAPGGTTVFYQRFNRHMAPSKIRVRLPASGEPARLEMSRSLLDAFDIEYIQPMPARSVTTPDGIVFEFDAAPSPTKAAIALSLTAHRIGIVSGTIGLAGHASIPITQIIYP